MIRSVVLSLKYIGVEEKRIPRYQNFNFFQKLFLSLDFQYTELRKIQISNFLTSNTIKVITFESLLCILFFY